MNKIRVLVVDDSAFMRKVITDILTSDDEIEVVDTAMDGIWALEKLKKLDVDVVTLDVEMPRMDGVEALKKINEIYGIPVVMLSSYTTAGADIIIKALELGAFDFVLKPSLGTNFDADKLKTELIKSVKLCFESRNRHKLLSKMAGSSNDSKTGNFKKYKSGIRLNDIKAVCIAASTGGPKALSKVIADFPSDFKLPVLVVQHMPAGFTKAFAARLDSISKLKVKEAQDGDDIKKGWVYIAPGGFHMLVEGRRIKLNQDPPMHGVRPCADKLFISAAENIGGRIIGIVLTGMGKDGTMGLEAVSRHGGICIAEDESTCTIFGMPKSAIEKGVVNIVAPIDRIAQEVLQVLDSEGCNCGK